MNTGRLALLITAALLATAASPSIVDARPRPKKAKKFEANKTFGLGIMLGAPSGLSGKYFVGKSNAIDFGVGAIGYYRHRDGIHAHVDYLWHPVSLGGTDDFEVPLYLGVGARIYDFNDRDDVHGLALGIRAPIGVAMDFNTTPIDIFLEFALVADLFVDYYDRAGVDFNGAIGVRYYFN